MAAPQVEHSAAPLGQVHLPHNWEFADATARAAAVIIAADLGKIALQLDDGSYWRAMTAGSPGVWIAARSKYTPQVFVADVTLWVRSDGNDANDGSANTAGAAFQTMQHAMDVASSYVMSECLVSIKIGLAGTYGDIAAGPGPTGIQPNISGFKERRVQIIGLGPTTILDAVSLRATIAASSGAYLYIQDLKVQNTGGGGARGLLGLEGGIIEVGTGVVFGACALAHMQVSENGGIYLYNDYEIDGGASYHISSFDSGWVEGGNTTTLTGAPHFGSAFAYAGYSSRILHAPNIVGAATGVRWYIDGGGGIINSSPAVGYGLHDFPGDAEGFFGHEGGQYNGLVNLGYFATSAGTSFLVANLPAAVDALINTRSFVVDATLPMAGNYGAALVGGGPNKVPVICMGAALGWRIG